MKILITESQLDKVINNFIGNEFKGIHFVGSIPDRNVYYKYWVNDKGRILIAYHPHNGAEVPPFNSENDNECLWYNSNGRTVIHQKMD